MTVQLRDADVIVVGGGRAGLAVGYYLRRAGVDFLILDDQPAPGGARQHAWPSLRLFSPASYSSLAGWMMPPTGDDQIPDAAHVVDYLTRYEKRHDLPLVRPVRVSSVSLGDGGRLSTATDGGSATARAVVSATGTWPRPYVPAPFPCQWVAVVGGGNSGAQILAELSTVAETTWITQRPPRLLADDVDGRVLFQVASRRFAARRDGVEDPGGGIGGLGDIVMVPPVREARDRGVLVAEPPVSALTPSGVEWPEPARLRRLDQARVGHPRRRHTHSPRHRPRADWLPRRLIGRELWLRGLWRGPLAREAAHGHVGGCVGSGDGGPPARNCA